VTERFAISYQTINVETLKTSLQHAAAGGFCSFEGWVRNVHQGQSVQGLEYHAHPLLAESAGRSVIADVLGCFQIIDARCVHRVGKLAIGDLAVWVGVAAAHRDAAFAACREIIDRIKLEVPIWKHEHYAEQEARWRHD
jgi:molybdopterin synthase catalytic subunit